MKSNKRYRFGKNSILILGATSSIARAFAAECASQGANLYLASRDVDELNRIATDLIIRYQVKIYFSRFDAEDFNSHQSFWQQVLKKMNRIDGVLLAFGYLGDLQIPQPFSVWNKIIIANFSGAVSILNECADYFAKQKQGFIIGLSSVAGDRGRQSNYIYGAAKAALTTYLQGLRNKLFPCGVRVVTVKLGFVDTAMTFGLPGLFWVITPQTAAKRILTSLQRSKDVVYIPWFWRYIMCIIKLIPEKIFKRLKL